MPHFGLGLRCSSHRRVDGARGLKGHRRSKVEYARIRSHGQQHPVYYVQRPSASKQVRLRDPGSRLVYALALEEDGFIYETAADPGFCESLGRKVGAVAVKEVEQGALCVVAEYCLGWQRLQEAVGNFKGCQEGFVSSRADKGHWGQT